MESKPCGPVGRECYSALPYTTADCIVSCKGLYADVFVTRGNISRANKDSGKLKNLQDEYDRHKKTFSENWAFHYEDKYTGDMGDSMKECQYQPLQVIEIYFDTATFDEIKKDVSVTVEAQLGVIGGTLGLFAGFSILSAVELLYFCLKFMVQIISKNRKSM